MDTFKKLEQFCYLRFRTSSYEEAVAYAEQDSDALPPVQDPETNEWVVFVIP